MKVKITYQWLNLNGAPGPEEEVDDCVVGPQAKNIKTVVIDTQVDEGYGEAETFDDVGDIFIKKIVYKLPKNHVAKVCSYEQI